ncbi:MAG: hypothetical protein ACLRXQ_10300 [Phascolarctobacterium faecium]
MSGAKVIFNDDAQIIIDAAGNNAKGIYGWNGSQVNFAGDAAIKIGGVEGSAKEAYYVRAITAMTNSTVNVGGDAIFELEGSDTIGLDLSDNSAVNVDGNVVTSAKATTGSLKVLEREQQCYNRRRLSSAGAGVFRHSQEL